MEALRDASPSSHITVKSSGEEAMTFLSQSLNSRGQLPDLILMDMNLPGKSGLQLLEELKKDPRLKEISIVALTGSMDPDEMAAVTAYPDCRYLVKPLDMDGYFAIVQELL
jgi:chemotaxis family two-component system response regulator Rcp1